MEIQQTMNGLWEPGKPFNRKVGIIFCSILRVKPCVLLRECIVGVQSQKIPLNFNAEVPKIITLNVHLKFGFGELLLRSLFSSFGAGKHRRGRKGRERKKAEKTKGKVFRTISGWLILPRFPP